MSTPTTDVVRVANRELRSFLSRVRETGQSATGGNGSASVGLEDIQNVCHHIQQVGRTLRNVPPGGRRLKDLEEALVEYRELLEEAQPVLAGLEQRLQERRGQLQGEMSHMNAAAAWARSSVSFQQNR